MLFDKLRQIEERSEELERALADPKIYGQPAEFARLRKEHADSSEIVDRFREYREVLRRLGEARHLLTDGGDRELAELAQLEIDELSARQTALESDLKRLLLPRKFERRVHRVQRVPATESAGRIHTSTVTVAVLPEAADVDVKVEEKDIRVDVYRSSGPGGQGVNTTDSAVRITHIPTGLVVTCQDERSQLKNRAKALRVLKARLLERAQEEQQAAIAADRRSQVGTGERSERIRTYNFAQNRVTDHRVGVTLHRLPEVLEGDIDEVIEALAAAEQAERLERVAQ